MPVGIVPPLVNGTSYVWAQIVINILGVPLTGITGITYEEVQDITYNHGVGSYAVSKGKGRITAKGTLSVYMEELEALVKSAPNRRLQDFPLFDIPVSYMPFDGVVPVSHKIRNVSFTTNKRESKEGDTKVEITLDFIATHIDF